MNGLTVHPGDHDLLIRVDENLKNLIIEVKAMRDDSIQRIRDLELGKVDRQELKDTNVALVKMICDEEVDRKKVIETLDKRMQKLERFGYIAVGALGLIQLVGIPLIFKYFNI